VLAQQFEADDFEVIIVNDSASPLKDVPGACSGRVRVLDTFRRERSFARNAGAAAARGAYLHFLDDDDELTPGALARLHGLSCQRPEAAWLCGAWQTVDDEGRLIDEFHPKLNGNIFALLVAGEGLPLQASALKSEAFFAVGGFDTSPWITGVEDRDLGRRVAHLGSLAYVNAVVARVRVGEAGSTTNWSTVVVSDQRARESALRGERAFRRIRESARSTYLRGRVARAYLGSASLNLRRRDLATATSRLLHAVVLTGWRFATPSYWRGLKHRMNHFAANAYPGHLATSSDSTAERQVRAPVIEPISSRAPRERAARRQDETLNHSSR
jgi:glycosyltransferase involved in cell wall biosynthesis